MKNGKINKVGGHLREAFRNSSFWNCRLGADLVFSGFLQFPLLPLVLPLGRNVLLRTGNLSWSEGHWETSTLGSVPLLSLSELYFRSAVKI